MGIPEDTGVVVVGSQETPCGCTWGGQCAAPQRFWVGVHRTEPLH